MRTIVQIAAAVAVSAAAIMSSARPVTVGTSNVKCPAPWDPDPSHAWQARRDFLFSVWKAHNPDVMALQEAVAGYLPDIDAAFPGWDRISAGRDDGLDGGEACPLYWNRERFSLLESGTFWLSSTPEVPGSRFEGAHHPRICTFAFLEERSTGRVFCFYNTHTSYVSGKLCAAQLEVIAADIRCRAPAGAAVVLTGDLNFELSSPALAPLTGAGLSDADEVCVAPLRGLWNSATLYRNYPASAPAEAVRRAARETGSWDKAKKLFPDLGTRIDHIYVSDDLTVKSCGVDGTNRAGHYPSDHMPKFAELEWRKTPSQCVNVKPGTSFALADALSVKGGGVAFWAEAAEAAGGELFRLKRKGRTCLVARMSGGNRAVVNVERSDGKKPIRFTRTYPGETGDRILVALSWNGEGRTRFFINHLPYLTCLNHGQRMPPLENPDLDGIDEVEFADGRGAVLHRLVLFSGTPSNRDIWDEYRRVMPFDMVMEASIVPEEKPVAATLQIAPGGGYTRPMPVIAGPVTGSGDFVFRVLDENGRTLLTEKRTLSVRRKTDVALPFRAYPRGRYRLEVTKDGFWRRTFRFAAFTAGPPGDRGAAETPRPGQILYRRVLPGSESSMIRQGDVRATSISDAAETGYLEAGSSNGDRFSFEIPFAIGSLGRPVALDVEWPDDDARLMGLYMYALGIPACRDRLQQGISAGREIPSSGLMRTTRFIFYPGVTNYLFEARTLAAGMPAAVRSVTVRELEGGLPPLKVYSPPGLPARTFGFYDEDQTFHMNLNADAGDPRSPCYREYRRKYPFPVCAQMAEISRYFDHVGINAMTEPVWRYQVSYFPSEGQTGNTLFPSRSLSWVWNEFDRRGYRFTASMNFMNLPELKLAGLIDAPFRTRGMVTLDKDGHDVSSSFIGPQLANIAHPETRRLFAAHIEEPIRRCAGRGLKGIQWDMSTFGSWGGLERGYDDWTVARFSRDSGIVVPSGFAERFAALTGPHRKCWLAWRAGRVTAFVEAARSALDRAGDGLALQLLVPDNPRRYEEQGIDIGALKRIRGVTLAVLRRPTRERHALHWGKEPSSDHDGLYDLSAADPAAWRTGGAVQAVRSAHTYFETFTDSLDRRRYPCYFENVDAKPHGRFFLRELAFSLAAYDMLEYTSGGQPIASIGREEETREFAAAFRALPALPFRDAGGKRDPVVMRYLPTENGTYFYLVNLFHEPVTVRSERLGGRSCRNLSDGTCVTGGEFRLKGFETASYLVAGEKTVLDPLQFVSTTPEAVAGYARRIASLESALERLSAAGLKTDKPQAVLKRIASAMDADAWAEAYRLAYSLEMIRLLENSTRTEKLLAEEKMAESGDWRVNCGSNSYLTTSDGKVFLPDRKFDGRYGWEGTHASVARDITDLKGSADAELYASEAYRLGSYRFKVPEGKYRVRLWMKHGWPRGFIPGASVFSVTANGATVLERFDLYEAQKGDFGKALRREFEIGSSGGEIRFEWHWDRGAAKGDPTVTLVNAIELEAISAEK